MNKASNIWQNLEQRCIHPELYSEPKELQQARILFGFCLIAGALCLLTIALGWFSKPQYSASYFYVATGHILTCSSVVLLRFCKTMKVPSFVMMVLTILQLGQAPLWTGFHASPVLYTYPLATMFMGIVGGKYHALCTGMLLSLISIVQWRLGIEGFHLGSGPQLPVISTTVLIWCTLSTMALAIYNLIQERSLMDRIEEELVVRTHAQATAEQANVAKDMFLAYLSHEIRNPLTVIVGSVEMLTMKKDTTDHHRYMQSLQSASSGLSRLLDDVLDFSSLQRQQLDLQLTSVDLSALLREVHLEFDRQATLKKLNFQMDIDVECWVIVDRIRLKQVLVNLVSNAIKYTREGSVDLELKRFNNTVRVLVKDTGTGISEDKLDVIFQPFEREHTVQAFGVGLGLAICKGLLELMDSDIYVESQPDVGSQFYFDLPVREKQYEKEIPVESIEGSLSGLKVLIVDDNSAIVSLYKDHLEQIGCLVQVAENGELGLDIVSKWKPAVLLLDLDIPLVSGQEVIATLKQSKQSPMVVVITGNAHVEIEEKRPVYRMLKKPTTLRKIEQVLRAAVSEFTEES